MNKRQEKQEQETKLVAPHSSIGEAICAVMASIRRLEKADKNNFANYKFTSVDDFKDLIRPLMADNGLYIHVNEDEFELVQMTNDKNKQTTMAKVLYSITLKHGPSGQEEPAEPMTVILPFTGAQTSGAAKSYAIKEWSKSRFLASSGDVSEEADMQEQSNFSDDERLSKAAARPLEQELREEMQKINDSELLGAWWQEEFARIKTLPKDWALMLKNDVAVRGRELKANEDLDRMTNEQLDELAMGNQPKEQA